MATEDTTTTLGGAIARILEADALAQILADVAHNDDSSVTKAALFVVTLDRVHKELMEAIEAIQGVEFGLTQGGRQHER